MRSNDRLWFCAALAVALSVNVKPAWAQRPLTLQTEAQQAAEEKILDRLKQHVSGHFVEQPLSDVLQKLARSAEVTIRLDIKALEDASIGADSPVTFDTANVTLRAALKSMLGRMDLTWLIKNEAILVTTPERAGNELMTRIYPVYDLVTAGHANRRFNGYRPLMDTITATLAPTTWDEVGGPGAIHEFRASGALVISQTFEVHEDIVLLLKALRRVRDDQHIPHEGLTSRPGSSKLTARSRVNSAARQPLAPATVLLAPNIYD